MTSRRGGVRRAGAVLASIGAFAILAAAVDRPWRATRFPAKLSASDEPEVLGALVDYQRLYEDFFGTGGGVAMLDAFPATKDLKHVMFRDLGYLGRSGLVMVQDLAEATVVESSRTGPDEATVVVYEQWNWTLARASDRKLLSEVKGLGQGFRYELRREQGRWLVSAWDLADLPAPQRDLSRKW